jgi:hypothetical protein
VFISFETRSLCLYISDIPELINYSTVAGMICLYPIQEYSKELTSGFLGTQTWRPITPFKADKMK